MTIEGRNAPGRVMLVDLAIGFGGAEARVIDTALGLGPGVASVALLAGTPMWRRATEAGVDVVSLSVRRDDPRLVGMLRGEIRRGGYDVVDAHNVQSQLWGHLAARAEDVPVMVSTVHSEYRAENKGLKGWTHQQVLRRNARWGCRFVAVSDRIHAYLRALTGPECNVETIRRGFPPSLPRAQHQIDRADLGWQDDDVVFGVVGRFAPAKGHHVLLDAVAMATGRESRARFYLVGDGPMKTELQARVGEEGLGGRVQIADFTDDVGSIFDLVDFLCLPSVTEGLPNVMLEAAAARIPLIATKVGEIPSLLQDGIDAYLVDAGDPAALRSAIESAVDQADRGMGLADSAFDTLSRQLSSDWIGQTRQFYLP